MLNQNKILMILAVLGALAILVICYRMYITVDEGFRSTKCFSCEKQMPQLSHGTKCFSCEQQMPQVAHGTKCLSCEYPIKPFNQ
uniref:Uncharacterized protein n=1 Tax=viral metagenome TaxID=1070528 RepID=A0A6C0J990_9ZZZZ